MDYPNHRSGLANPQRDNQRPRRSVIVKINDRGPYIRGRIIDLSPHAADVLEMKRIGVVVVVVEPLVY